MITSIHGTWRVSYLSLSYLLHRFVAISDLYEPTDDGSESQVGKWKDGWMMMNE